MNALRSDFRRRLWSWLAPLLFVLVNVALYFERRYYQRPARAEAAGARFERGATGN